MFFHLRDKDIIVILIVIGTFLVTGYWDFDSGIVTEGTSLVKIGGIYVSKNAAGKAAVAI